MHLEYDQKVCVFLSQKGCIFLCSSWERNMSARAMLQHDCRERDWPVLTQGRNPVFPAYSALLPEMHQQDADVLTQEGLQKPRFLQKSPSPVHRGETSSLRFTLTSWQSCCFPSTLTQFCILGTCLDQTHFMFLHHLRFSTPLLVNRQSCWAEVNTAWLLSEENLLLFLDYGTVSGDPGLIATSTDTCH